MFKFVENYKYRRQLKKAREELQLLWDHANNRRTVHTDNTGWEKYRDITDFFNSKELAVWNEIAAEEWALSKMLGENPEWGSAKQLGSLFGPDAPKGMISVQYDQSTKISFEYVELVDMMVRTINGKWSSTRWDWEPVESFKKQGWGRNQAFHDAVDEWHAAETPEAKQEVIDKYKEENPQWSL